ncbi:MAG: low molecular weight phosphotyrosine protein phosphatase [Lentisphaerae bacterium]|nr:low molecular weight phosphotyrosine protein phosphatase [Lentisphaerota bacterium]
MNTVIKILFVCHGNICRSPMAEFVMKEMVKNSGLQERIYIESAATSTEELGNPVYPPARKIMAQHGIDCKNKTARQITRADYDNFDYIVAMDEYNIRNMRRFFGNDPENKVSLLLSWANENREVADPWYTGDFEATWRDVNLGCKALLEQILK